jgi:hypothetical protein
VWAQGLKVREVGLQAWKVGLQVREVGLEAPAL